MLRVLLWSRDDQDNATESTPTLPTLSLEVSFGVCTDSLFESISLGFMIGSNWAKALKAVTQLSVFWKD